MGTRNHGGKSKRCGDPEAARRVIAMLDGEPVLEPEPFVPRSRRDGDGKYHVSGLEWETTEADLREFLAPFVRIVELHVFKDSFTGRSRGFAVLRCVGDATVLNGSALQGRMITIAPWQG